MLLDSMCIEPVVKAPDVRLKRVAWAERQEVEVCQRHEHPFQQFEVNRAIELGIPAGWGPSFVRSRNSRKDVYHS